jgi:hypothetical protein
MADVEKFPRFLGFFFWQAIFSPRPAEFDPIFCDKFFGTKPAN